VYESKCVCVCVCVYSPIMHKISLLSYNLVVVNIVLFSVRYTLMQAKHWSI
jgi:hypothetical protein